MAAGRLPEEIAQAAESLLVRPDKNSQQWKALDAACAKLGKTPDRLLLDLGAWPHALALHKRRFLAVNFPRGLAFPDLPLPAIERELPLADAEIYSVDDITTTEIDDALSVTTLPDGKLRVGVHVAAPGIVVTRDSEFDKLARARLSTVYMPGDKIPMQPDSVISAFAGRRTRGACPVAIRDGRPRDRRGPRIGNPPRTRDGAREPAPQHAGRTGHRSQPGRSRRRTALWPWLRLLWKLAQALSAQRENVRGKPENNSRVEYSFYLDGNPDDPDTPVRLVPRQRNAPLDRMVAEYMILANNLWGGLLHQHGVPGIYRSQQAGRVRMSTQALPHEAIGVPQYAWSTSPLRRYVDLVNQWQLIAAVEHGVSARLVAPFKPRDADLFAIIGAFDAQYATWAEFQSAMERYWCLRWLKQHNITRTVAHVLRDDLVRFGNAPLVTRVGGMPELERGTAVEIDILGMDELARTGLPLSRPAGARRPGGTASLTAPAIPLRRDGGPRLPAAAALPVHFLPKPARRGPLPTPAAAALPPAAQNNHQMEERHAHSAGRGQPRPGRCRGKQLRLAGHSVQWARDGLTALRRGLDETWDALVLDINLPGKDGFGHPRTARGRTGSARAGHDRARRDRGQDRHAGPGRR